MLQLEGVRRVDRDRHDAGLQAADQRRDELEPGRIDEHGAVAGGQIDAAAEVPGDRAGLGGEQRVEQHLLLAPLRDHLARARGEVVHRELVDVEVRGDAVFDPQVRSQHAVGTREQVATKRTLAAEAGDVLEAAGECLLDQVVEPVPVKHFETRRGLV